MTEPIPESVVTGVTVQEKALADEEKQEWKLTLDVPAFRSRFPTYCTRVPVALAVQFKVGGSYQVELKRQSLRKNQDGSFKSGQYHSDYYWGLVGLASAGVAAPSASPEPGEAAQPLAIPDPRAVEQASIEAQTAYKGALGLLGERVWPTMSFAKVADLIEPLTCLGYQAIQAAKRVEPSVWPKWFWEDWESLHTGGASEPQGDIVPQDLTLGSITKTPQAPVPPQRPQEAPPKPEAEPKSMGVVMEWARQQKKATGDVLVVLQNAGYMASDRTPLRSIIQVLDAWHQDEARKCPTPAEVKALCRVAWNILED